MSEILSEVTKALHDAGAELKADLWKPADKAFLEARAKDLIGLNTKAAAATDPLRQKAYLAAARDVVNHVRLAAVIRMEVATTHVFEALGRFFIDKLLPLLFKVLPALVGL